MNDTSKRNREIYALKELGRSSCSIGIQFGIDESRVRQIYKREKEKVKLENHHAAAIQNNNTAYYFYDALTDVCDSIPIRNRVYSILDRAGVIQEMYDLDESLDLYSDESLLLIKSFGPKFLAIARKANELYVQKKKNNRPNLKLRKINRKRKRL